jgi:hypothetical protein
MFVYLALGNWNDMGNDPIIPSPLAGEGGGEGE